MTTNNYEYAVRGKCGGPKAEKPAIFGAKFLRTLDALSRIDPLLSGWQICRNWNIAEDDEPRQIPLDAARERIVEIVENGVVHDDFGEAPEDGHSACATAGARGSRYVTFAARTSRPSFDLSFGEHDIATDLSIVTYPLFRAALLAINSTLDAQWSYAHAVRNATIEAPWDLAPGVPAFRIESAPPVPIDPTFPKSAFHVPWIVYLSAKHASGVRVAREILTERMPDGGLLMSATTDRLDPMNPEHVRGARILAETLIACAS